MNDTRPQGQQQMDYVPLKVTAGILVHIGAGIYNSIAGAVKELVSNSYDADASSVTISMDYPYFNEIKVADNGRGMSSLRLRQAMQTIGSSLKDLENAEFTSDYQRPIIGKLGIGLMALSQVCKKARIESQEPGTNSKLIAELDFSQFKDREEEQMLLAKIDVLKERYGGVDVMKDIIENPETDEDFLIEVQTDYDIALMAEEKVNELKSKNKPNVDVFGEHLGYCILYPDIPASPDSYGTTITLTEIDNEVKNQLRDQGRSALLLPEKFQNVDNPWEEYRNEINSWDWAELCERLQLGISHLRFSDLPYYHRFLWELAIMTPVQYLKDGPIIVDDTVLKTKKEEIRRFKFNLTVDKHSLRKPILLPSGNVAKEINSAEVGLDYNIRPVSFDGEVEEHRLSYHGYLFWQREQNLPNMVQGLQIYIRNVGIGLFDRTLLNYDKVNPGTRIPQISGEIYVENGLESALSVDRSSFRDTDAHYAHLRNHVWDLLGVYKGKGSGLFGASVDSYHKRKEIKDKQATKEHIEELTKALLSSTKNEVPIRFIEDDAEIPYEYSKKEMIINQASPYWPKAVKMRSLYQRVLIPVKVAVENGATARQILELLEFLLLGIEGEKDAK